MIINRLGEQRESETLPFLKSLSPAPGITKGLLCSDLSRWGRTLHMAASKQDAGREVKAHGGGFHSGG